MTSKFTALKKSDSILDGSPVYSCKVRNVKTLYKALEQYRAEYGNTVSAIFGSFTFENEGAYAIYETMDISDTDPDFDGYHGGLMDDWKRLNNMAEEAQVEPLEQTEAQENAVYTMTLNEGITHKAIVKDGSFTIETSLCGIFEERQTFDSYETLKEVMDEYAINESAEWYNKEDINAIDTHWHKMALGNLYDMINRLHDDRAYFLARGDKQRIDTIDKTVTIIDKIINQKEA